MESIQKIMDNIKQRNKNKNINTLPMANNFIDSQFCGLASIKNKLCNFHYVNTPDFFIPLHHQIYYSQK